VLTVLQEKLAEGHALAMAATTVTEKVEALVADEALIAQLVQMREEAEETRTRCLAVESTFGGEIAETMLAHAQTTKEKAADLAGAWFKAGTGPLAAWSFLAMGEAAEVAVWSALEILAAKADDQRILALAAWALPIQRAHLDTAFSGTARVAELRNPNGARWG
jgi:hypothetical protein